MKWFGKSWHAPICDPADHGPTPVGEPCHRCTKPIAEDAQGVSIPEVSLASGVPVVTERAWHLECFLRSIGIAAAERVVHVLHHGRSLCQLEGLGGPEPCHWPAGHVWVRVDEPGATCATCRGELARRKL